MGPNPGRGVSGNMRKLHLVGYAPDQGGFVLTARKGSRSGGYFLALDDDLLDEMERARSGDDADEVPTPAAVARPSVASGLTPREIQSRLRAGHSIEEVASEAGVDVEWVDRFAAPVLAEQSAAVERAGRAVLHTPRKGPSDRPLEASIRRNLVERGVVMAEEDFSNGWAARHLVDTDWLITFRFRQRGRAMTAEWLLNTANGALTTRNRLGADLGFIEPGRRLTAAALPDDPEAPAVAGPARSARRKAPVRKRAAKRAGTARAGAVKGAGVAKRPAASKRPAAAKRAAVAKRARVAKRPAVAKSAAVAKRAATTRAAGVKRTAVSKRVSAKSAPATNQATAAKRTAAAKRVTVAKAPAKRPAAAQGPAKRSAVQKVAAKRAAVESAPAKRRAPVVDVPTPARPPAAATPIAGKVAAAPRESAGNLSVSVPRAGEAPVGRHFARKSQQPKAVTPTAGPPALPAHRPTPPSEPAAPPIAAVRPVPARRPEVRPLSGEAAAPVHRIPAADRSAAASRIPAADRSAAASRIPAADRTGAAARTVPRDEAGGERTIRRADRPLRANRPLRAANPTEPPRLPLGDLDETPANGGIRFGKPD